MGHHKEIGMKPTRADGQTMSIIREGQRPDANLRQTGV